MKVLIIGDWPKYHGGVVNYTRPLALELCKLGHEVSYLYSTTNLAISTFSGMIIKEELNNEFPFKSYCLWNGKALLRNYDDLTIDVSSWIDEKFEEFLNKIKPDIIHINEIFGFSSSLINVCKKLNISVINTVHEYWYLCPHRVMVDYNKKICEGPSNISKCALCVEKKLPNFNRSKILLRQRMNYYLPNISQYIYRKKINKKVMSATNIDLEFGNETFVENKFINLEQQIEKRLNGNINALNNSSLIIAVSSDVKKTLIKYGVEPKKILVQHIGSKVAETIIEHTKEVNENKIVFGFIGGVGYYKGVHLIVQAFNLLNEEVKSKCMIKIFGKADQAYQKSIELLIPEKYKKVITFEGKFTPQDIPKISNEIDISILPSLCADTAPQTIFESYSTGLPILAPNIGGFPDFIDNNVNGLIFEPANPTSLSEKMLEIINSPQILDKFKSNIPKMKSLKENTKELIKIYEEISN